MLHITLILLTLFTSEFKNNSDFRSQWGATSKNMWKFWVVHTTKGAGGLGPDQNFLSEKYHWLYTQTLSNFDGLLYNSQF